MVHIHSYVTVRMVCQAPASPLARTPPAGSACLLQIIGHGESV